MATPQVVDAFPDLVNNYQRGLTFLRLATEQVSMISA